MDDELLVWDSLLNPTPLDNQKLYFWNNYSEEGGTSLLRYVDTHGMRLREKYLTWVYELGEVAINGVSLIDSLKIEGDFSYWWMTSFVEKSPWKSPSIVDALRVFGLEEILLSKRPKKLKFVTSNKNLLSVLKNLCNKLGVNFEGELIVKKSFPNNWSALYKALPVFLQGVLYMAHFAIAYWQFKKLPMSNADSKNKNILFCSYFGNINLDLAKNGQFYTYYWGPLHNFLKKVGVQCNWLQIFVPSNDGIKKKLAIDLVTLFNKNHAAEGFHVFIQRYISFRVLIKALNNWIKLFFICSKIPSPQIFFEPKGHNFNLWPIMRKDWLSSFYGATAVKNLLWLELFDRAMASYSRQEVGFYLCENQSWERALAYAWRKHGHGYLLGVVHATVRFWDLRYCGDPRPHSLTSAAPCPCEDFALLNGDAAVYEFTQNKYPRNRILKCEALRYLHLSEKQNNTKHNNTKSKNILILGDINVESTNHLLKMTELVAGVLDNNFQFNFKPHPYGFVNHNNYSSLKLKIEIDPLALSLERYDLVIACNATSAAVDAYYSGLSVLVMLESNELNYSPLRGCKGVTFFASATELILGLRANNSSHEVTSGDSFFYLDKNLNGWKKLLTNHALSKQ